MSIYPDKDLLPLAGGYPPSLEDMAMRLASGFFSTLALAVSLFGLLLSGLGGRAQIGPMRKVAGRLKLELSQYRDLEAFAQFGSDLDPDTQRTLARGERLVASLNQNERSPLPIEDQVIQVFAATNGFVD